jgi:uncharacterized protein YeaO (DUF488 family)
MATPDDVKRAWKGSHKKWDEFERKQRARLAAYAEAEAEHLEESSVAGTSTVAGYSARQRARVLRRHAERNRRES